MVIISISNCENESAEASDCVRDHLLVTTPYSAQYSEQRASDRRKLGCYPTATYATTAELNRDLPGRDARLYSR